MITAGFVLLTVAAAGFAFRLIAGPSLTDRIVGLDGLIVVGVSAITLRAMATGEGAFIPVALVATLVGFVGTAVVARFIERAGG